jgi:uncharacterized phage-associated protein
MSPIRFRFDVEKLVQALALFAKLGVPNLDKLKAMKLLFFADKEHLLRYGRPILGDQYWCMPYGPVPSVSFNILRDFVDSDPEVEPFAKQLFAEYFDVDRDAQYPRLVAKRDPDLDVFSDAEIEVLTAVAKEYGRRRATDLSKLTHDDPVWAIPAKTRAHDMSSVEIPYELFFTTADATDLLRLAQAQQEDRDFDNTISYEFESARR